jgi:hypothetical protein
MPFTADLHEFRLTSQTSALFTAYTPRLHQNVWVLDSLFQEIDLEDGQVLYSWSALDHVSLSQSHVLRGSYPAAGDGSAPSKAWDYFHINSIDKSKDGHYLISSRHTDCIYLVSKTEGSIIWRLNGDNSSFELSNFTFRRQHHARFLTESTTQTTLSLYDNDNDGFTAKGSESRGLTVSIDHESGIARKVVELQDPGGHVTPSMGNVEIQPGGNFLVGGGDRSTIAEHLQDGTPIWSAHMSPNSRNYRAHKAKWVGQPRQPPAVYSQFDTADSSTHVCMSWNGATEVELWHIHASASEMGPFTIVGEARKGGFETTYRHGSYLAWVFVATVGNNSILANSTVVRTASHSEEDQSEPGWTGSLVTANEHLLDAPISPPAIKPAKQFSGHAFWTLWQYVEHIMAAIGFLVCFVRGANIVRAR